MMQRTGRQLLRSSARRYSSSSRSTRLRWFDDAGKVHASTDYEQLRQNWAENVPLRHSHLSVPDDVEGLQVAVRDAELLRVVGSAHSFTPLSAAPSETMLSLSSMSKVIGLDADSMTVRVEGGCTFGEIGRWLQQRGAALRNMPSLPHVTFAGAVATGTHGSGLRPGRSSGSNLVSQVAAAEFVLADGTVRRLTRNDPELLPSLTSMGLLGVISSLEIDVVPAFDVSTALYTGASLAEFASSFVELGLQHDSVACFLNFQTAEVGALFVRDFIEPGDKTPELPSTLIGGGELVPEFEDTQSEGIVLFESMTRKPGTARANWLELLPFHIGAQGFRRDDPFPCLMLQAEFYVPLKFAEAAILALQPVAGSMSGWQPSDEWVCEPDRLQGTVIGTEMRLVRGTGEACWLSPFRDDSLALHFSFSRQDHAAALAACSEIQQCLAPFESTVHWGKLFDMGELQRSLRQQRFPSLGLFRELCVERDPDHKFRNGYLDELLFRDGGV